jgi:hypothetical protein
MKTIVIESLGSLDTVVLKDGKKPSAKPEWLG